MEIKVIAKHAAALILPGIIWIVTAPFFASCINEHKCNKVTEITLFCTFFIGGVIHIVIFVSYSYLAFIRDDHTRRQADFEDAQPMRLEVRYEPNYDRPPGIRRDISVQNGRRDQHPLVDPA